MGHCLVSGSCLGQSRESGLWRQGKTKKHMAELWRIPNGPNGTMVQTTDYNLVREFFKQKKGEQARLGVKTAVFKSPVSVPNRVSGSRRSEVG